MNKKLLNHLQVLDSQLKLLKLALAVKKRRKKHRKWSIRPINRLRSHLGYFKTLFQELKFDPDVFFRVTRMTISAFNYLHETLYPYLLKEKNNISPEERLAITVRYLTTGDRVLSIALEFRIGESTCYEIIQETCKVIFDRLSPVFLKAPTEEEWKAISEGFWEDWNMPNCIGSIDGKHVYIKAPPNSGALYFNYKKSFSVVIMGVCNHKYEFTLFDVGAVGSESDGGVLSRSELGKKLRNNQLNIPQGTTNLPDSDSKVPYYFVGDEAFGISTNLMRPFSGKNLNDRQAIFNYTLSRARQVIENTFGILVARWQFLSRSIGFHPQSVVNCVLASMCLHNFLMIHSDETRNLYCSENFIDRETEPDVNQREGWQNATVHNPLQELERNEDVHVLNGNVIRNTLADYFLTPQGEVSWQNEYINRGSYQDK